MGSRVDSFFDELIANDLVYIVVIHKGKEVLRAKSKLHSEDEFFAEKLIEFANKIFSNATDSLSKLPDIEGEISYTIIRLNNGFSLLFAKYDDLGLITVTKTDSLAEYEEIKQLLRRVKEIISGPLE